MYLSRDLNGRKAEILQRGKLSWQGSTHPGAENTLDVF